MKTNPKRSVPLHWEGPFGILSRRVEARCFSLPSKDGFPKGARDPMSRVGWMRGNDLNVMRFKKRAAGRAKLSSIRKKTEKKKKIKKELDFLCTKSIMKDKDGVLLS